MTKEVTENANEYGLFRTHFVSGQNISIFSIDAEHPFVEQYLVDEHLDFGGVESAMFNEEWSRPLKSFLWENRYEILTRRQRLFVEHVLKGDATEHYAKDNIEKYRVRIMDRVVTALAGIRLNYYHRLDTDLRNLALINEFRRISECSISVSEKIKECLDNALINEIVYGRISDNSRKAIVDCYLNGEQIPESALVEVYKYLYERYDAIHANFARHIRTRKL